MMISEARNFALKELLPINAEGDKQGLQFQTGQVKVPEWFHRAYKLLLEAEWTSLTEDPDWGGQGLPANMALAVGTNIFRRLLGPGQLRRDGARHRENGRDFRNPTAKRDVS